MTINDKLFLLLCSFSKELKVGDEIIICSAVTFRYGMKHLSNFLSRRMGESDQISEIKTIRYGKTDLKVYILERHNVGVAEWQIDKRN